MACILGVVWRAPGRKELGEVSSQAVSSHPQHVFLCSFLLMKGWAALQKGVCPPGSISRTQSTAALF